MTQGVKMLAVEQRAWEMLCKRLQRDPATSEEGDTCSLRAAWKAMLAFADHTHPAATGSLRGKAWRPFIRRNDVPTDGTWFVARSVKPGWVATRVVHYASKEDRLPTDGTGWMWPSEPTEWMPIDEFAAAPTPDAAASEAGEVERLREALVKIERAHRDWDPEANFAASALAQTCAIARAALTTQGGAEG